MVWRADLYHVCQVQKFQVRIRRAVVARSMYSLSSYFVLSFSHPSQSSLLYLIRFDIFIMRYFATLTALPLIFAAPLNERAEVVGPDKYIVVLKTAAPVPTISNVLANINEEHIYNVGNFKGYSATLSDTQIAALRLDPNVSQIDHVPTPSN